MQFLTLVEEIGYDSDESTTTFYMFLYRWAKLPTLQLVSEIERTEIVPGELIKFQNKDQSDEEMLPLEGVSTSLVQSCGRQPTSASTYLNTFRHLPSQI